MQMKSKLLIAFFFTIFFSCDKNEGVEKDMDVVRDVYISGMESSEKELVAKYWKNGSAVSLTDGTKKFKGLFHICIKQ
jgi:hypothetical protein